MYILYAQVTFRINPKGFYLESEFSKPRIHSQKEKKTTLFLWISNRVRGKEEKDKKIKKEIEEKKADFAYKCERGQHALPHIIPEGAFTYVHMYKYIHT